MKSGYFTDLHGTCNTLVVSVKLLVLSVTLIGSCLGRFKWIKIMNMETELNFTHFVGRAFKSLQLALKIPLQSPIEEKTSQQFNIDES